jgi:hypothetical protein
MKPKRQVALPPRLAPKRSRWNECAPFAPEALARLRWTALHEAAYAVFAWRGDVQAIVPEEDQDARSAAETAKLAIRREE